MKANLFHRFAPRNTLHGAVLALALSLGHSSVAIAQGIPVIDAAALAQQVQQVLAWAQQLQEMAKQYETMKSQLEAVQGPRGMGALLNNNAVRQVVPSEYSQQYELISKVGTSGASQGAKAIYNSVSKYDCTQQFPNNEASRINCESQAMRVSENASFIASTISSSQARVADLQVLLSKIDTAMDVKAAADLQNRIAIESAILENEKVGLDMALASQTAQKEVMALQRREEGKKAVMENTVNPFSQ